MSNTVSATRARRVFAAGEFVSPTQKHISRIDETALRVRAQGITILRDLISRSVGKEGVQELIAAMNYSVADCNKELKRRRSAA